MSIHRSFRLTRSAAIADTGKVSIIFLIMQQFVVLTLAAMILDDGQILQICGYAALAYWGGFVMIMARRHSHLTRTDRILIRWGFLMLCAVSSVVTGLIWGLRGY